MLVYEKIRRYIRTSYIGATAISFIVHKSIAKGRKNRFHNY